VNVAHVGGAAQYLQGIGHRQWVNVRVDDARVGVSGLRGKVDVILRGQPRSKVHEILVAQPRQMVNSLKQTFPSPSSAHVIARQHLIDFLAKFLVGGKVVDAAEQIVVYATGVGCR
jgi:hypothetical protein